MSNVFHDEMLAAAEAFVTRNRLRCVIQQTDDTGDRLTIAPIVPFLLAWLEDIGRTTTPQQKVTRSERVIR